MYKSLLSLVLSGLLFSQAAAAPQNAPPLSEKEARRADKVRAKVASLVTGEAARVRVSLRGRRDSRVVGYIREVQPESFTVVDPKTSTVTVIPYAQVKAINPNRAVPVLVAIGVGVGIIVTVVAVALAGLKGS